VDGLVTDPSLVVPVLRAPRAPLEFVEVRLDPPARNEVRVAMAASGVCHSCLHVMDGSITGAPLPIVLGDEGAGVVTAVGPGVTDIAVGDHVIISWAPSCGRCRSCVGGRPVLCLDQPPFGYLADGTTRMHAASGDVHHFGPATYAPEIVVPASCAVVIRRDMPLDRAALIGCSVMTGVGAVINTAQVPPGAGVAVFGCGGVGLNVVQGAALVSANPIIAVDVVESKLGYATAMGATHTVLDDGDAPGRIRSIEPRGVDYAFVAVGSDAAVAAAWRSLAPGGTCVMLGIMPTGHALSIPTPNELMGREVRLIGSRYGSARPSIDFPRLVDLYLAGRLRLDELISRRYPLADINEAHRALAAGEVARSIITFDDQQTSGRLQQS
jgi:S-(hydroxymethyl)glutathione dehydrogenase/alcohol dehydrogenase